MKKTAIIVIIMMLVLIAANTQAASVYHKPPFKPTNNTDIPLGDIKVNGDIVTCSANLLNIKLVEQKIRIYVTYSLFAPKILDAAAAVVVPLPDQENKRMEYITPSENQKSGEISFNIDIGNKKVFPKIYALIGAYAYAENPLNPDTWDFSFDFAFASVLCISNQLKISNKVTANTARIYYRISWGDGTYSTVGPYRICEPVKASHNWKNPGTHQIKAKIIGGSSDLSGKWFPLIIIKTDNTGNKKPADKKMSYHPIPLLPPTKTVHKYTAFNPSQNKPTPNKIPSFLTNIHIHSTNIGSLYLRFIQK